MKSDRILTYDEMRNASWDVIRQEAAVRDYLNGDIERIFTPEFTHKFGRLSQARVRAALLIRKDLNARNR